MFAYEVSQLASAKGKATIADLKEANRILEAMKKEEYLISTRALNIDTCQITVMTDASFQTQQDGKSQAGYIVCCNDLISNERSRANLVYWRSGRIKRVVHSTLGAEWMSACEGLDAGEIIRFMFSELIGRRANLTLMSDCLSLVRTSTKECLPRQKSLVLSLSEIRQFVKLEKCYHNDPLIHIDTQHQAADGLTKRIANRSNSLRPIIFQNFFIKKANTLRVKFGDVWAPDP